MAGARLRVYPHAIEGGRLSIQPPSDALKPPRSLASPATGCAPASPARNIFVSVTVRALHNQRDHAYQHGSVFQAIEHGMSLLSAGAGQVRIVDSTGREHCPLGLYRALLVAAPANAPLKQAA
jgi:hypothetical protein